MERALQLLEIIYASAVARKIQNLRQDVCCGCKIYAQDCLMMTEEEGWDMHGLAAMEHGTTTALRFGKNSSTFWTS